MSFMLRSVILPVLVVGSLLIGCSEKKHGDKKVNVPPLIEALKSADKDVRMNACIDLAKAGEYAAPAISALIPVLKDTDINVRRLAAYALGEIGPKAKEALPGLKEMLADPDRNVVMQAVNSMRNIDPASVPSQNMPNVMTPTPAK